MDKLDWFKELVDRDPENAQTQFFYGKELLDAGKTLEAITVFTKALGIPVDENLRNEIVRSLTEATQRLQGHQDRNKPDDDDGDSAGQDDHDNMKRRHTAPTQEDMRIKPTLYAIEGGREGATNETPQQSRITFEDVAGLDALKKTIQLRIISPFFNQGLFTKFRKKAGGGVLLYGPPGCGKTYIAKATAGECRATFVPVHVTDILDPYIGVMEQNLKDVLDRARLQKPSVVFFDEVDALGFSRAKASSNMRGLVDTLLSEMEGIDTNTDQLLMIGATNMPWDVDSALKRPGRFDRLVFVAPPDQSARDRLFQLKLHGRFIQDIDTAKLAKITEFYSGADIENVCELAAERVIDEILQTGNERPISMRDMEEVISGTGPSTLEWLRTVKNYVKYANQSGLYNDVEEYLKSCGRRI